MPPSTEVTTALDAVVAGARGRDLESKSLDFKTVGRSHDDAYTDLAHAAACFANAEGGVLVVGVADRVGGPEALVGCPLDEATTRLRIFQRTDPSLTVHVERFTYAGHELLLIAVPEGATLHSVKGKHTERVGTSCMPMDAGRIARVMADRTGDDWSDHPSPAGLDTVDPVAMAVARRFLGNSIDPVRQGYAQLTDPDLLRALGVVSRDGVLNRAGALLFAAAPDGRDVIAYTHRRTPSGALTANESFTTPLLTALDRVFDLISARVDRTSVDIGRGQQLQIEDLPETAVREAVVNAVMHRDHRSTARVMIDHAATRLAVTSPGPFISGVSPSNVLTAASRSRNPRLAEAIRKLGLAETAGTGVDRMYASMARLGHQPPAFEADEATVRVTLIGGAPNAYLTRFISTMPAGTADDADTMLVLLTLLGRRTVSAEDMADTLQKPVREVQSVLGRLAAPPLHLLEPTRESAGWTHPTYRLQEAPIAALGPAVIYRRRTTDSSDRKILALLRESGSINARMVRLLLDTDTGTTSRILGDLVERELLVKTSTATRGPGVTYGPGPKLPKKKRGRTRPGHVSGPSATIQPNLFTPEAELLPSSDDEEDA